jgi:polyhydroxybutyrate depolymerase
VAERSDRLPLVLVLHGSGGEGSRYLDLAGWAEKSETAGFIVVAPDALPAKPWSPPQFFANPRIWNAGQQAADRPRSRIDDAAFIRALLDDLAGRHAIDLRRVYVVGHSNGGSLAFRLACELPGRFAAMAVVASHCYIEHPRPSEPVPTLFLVGDRDPIMPMEGGLAPLPWEIRRRVPPVAQTLSTWAAGLGIDPRTRKLVRETAAATVYQYTKERRDGAAADLVAVIIRDQGHGWPGGRGLLWERALGPNAETVKATDLAWEFFARSARP